MDDFTTRAPIGRPVMPVQTSPQLRAIARLLDVPLAAFSEPVHAVEVHASTNGDHWLLRRGVDGKLVVRHIGNAASGGHVTDEAVASFLARDPVSPQRAALAELIDAALGARFGL